MPRHSRPYRDESRDLGARFRRLREVAARRRSQSRKRPVPSAQPPRTPPTPRPDSLDGLRLPPAAWPVLARHLYRLVRLLDPQLAAAIWQQAWAVGQGLWPGLSTESLPTRRPPATAALNPRRVRLAYDALMRDLRGDARRARPPLATAHPSEIVTRLQERLRTLLEPGTEPVPLAWPPSSTEAPWPALVPAVRSYARKAAAVEILAWALGKKPSYINRLTKRRKRRKHPLGL